MNSEELKAYDLTVENHERAMARVAELEREVERLSKMVQAADFNADCDRDTVRAAELALKTQPGGVVLPERKDSWVAHGDEYHRAEGFNEALDEVARLNQQPASGGDDAERAAFEAAAVDDNFGLLRVLGEKAEEMGLEHGDYIDLAARHAWKYWQARAALAQSERVPDNLRERCKEILEWKRTGILKGNALHEYASRQRYAGDHAELVIAESETATQAFEFIAAPSPSKGGE